MHYSAMKINHAVYGPGGEIRLKYTTIIVFTLCTINKLLRLIQRLRLTQCTTVHTLVMQL